MRVALFCHSLLSDWNHGNAHFLRGGGRCALLFHDTHHRSVTRPEEIARFDLSAYDGVLAFGESLREGYVAGGWGRRAWTWHEAADTSTFRRLLVSDPPHAHVCW